MRIRWALALTALMILSSCVDRSEDSSPAPGTYAPLRESPIRGLSTGEIESIRNGAGMQLALPAELNGYPGPKHILELGDDLGLNATQRSAVEALYKATVHEARIAGEELLKRWKALDDGFRNGTLDDAGLRVAVRALDAQQAEVRFAHLSAHLAAYDILTSHQRALYMELRGYGGMDHSSHDHG